MADAMADGPAEALRRLLLLGLPADGVLCFACRCLRMVAYGGIAPVFFLFCLELGFSEVKTGALLTCILVGDLFITLFLTTRADKWGRRRTLCVGAALKVLAGLAFAFSRSYAGLVFAGIVGVISTSGGECGPFLAVEQAALTDSALLSRGLQHTGSAADVAPLFGWYNALGYWSQAVGALASGYAVELLQKPPAALSPLLAYRCIFVAYAATGAVMALLYALLSPAAEARDSTQQAASRGPFGLRKRESVRVVARLSAWFTLDAFAGAFTMQTFAAFWFTERWGLRSDRVGVLLSIANLVSGASGVAASHLVKRIGAMLTMIVTHLPSNVLLLAVPLMPTAFSASAMLVGRFCISQMDVPARQAYVAMAVDSDERSAAGGITNIVRSLGMSFAPLLLGYLSSAKPRTSFEFSSPWLISGVLKIVYDIGLYSNYWLEERSKRRAADAAEVEALLLQDADDDAAPME
jgi:predicted MFS family arabinose efflux permease